MIPLLRGIPSLDASHIASVNGTILGGTFMVKEKEDWEALQDAPHALDTILESIGYPTLTPDQPAISPNVLPSSTHL